MIRLLTPILIAFLLLHGRLVADWGCRPDSCVRVSSAIGNQWNIRLAPDGRSGAILVWQDRRNGSADKLFLQRIGSSGNPMWDGNGIQLANTPGLQYYPEILSDQAGGAFITWQDNRYGVDYDIFAQRIGPDGSSRWFSNGVLVSNAAGHQYNPQLVPDGQGGVIIVWQDKRNGDFDIYAQRLNAAGQPLWSTNGEPVCVQPGDQVEPRLVPDGLNGAIIAWTDYRAGTGFSDVYSQRISPDGQRIWIADGEPLCSATNTQWNVDLVPDGVGGAIASWQDRRSSLFDNIFAQRIDGTGHTLWTADGVQLAPVSGLQYYPRMSSDGSGGAIAVWQDNRRGSDYDIYAQRVDPAGTILWGGKGQAVCTAKGHQYNPQLIVQSGEAIITWQDKRGTDFDIYTQCLGPDGAPAWQFDGVPVAIPPRDQFLPQICSDGVMGAIIAWPDYQRGDGSTDIFSHRIGANGRLAGGCFRTITQAGYSRKPEKFRNKFTGFIGAKPNEGNIRDSIFARGAFANGIRNGIERLDSARRYGWQLFTSAFYLKHALPQNGTPRPFDRLFERFFVGLMRNPSNKRYNNAISGELLTLKLNIAASDLGITPSEFGDVIFVDTSDAQNPLNNRSLREVANTVDTLLTYWRAHPRVNYEKLNASLVLINNGFAQEIDTISTSPIRLKPTVALLSIPYLLPGAAPGSAARQAQFQPTAEPPAPGTFDLLQNYPNPFNPVTTIEFELKQPSIVTLKVYNVLGQEVARLLNRTHLDEGRQLVDFDASSMSTGIYFYQLLAERLSENGTAFSQVRKMVFIK
ncbi:MAG TPA: T9SS type A sorting domain-containing protein [Bacteroidota bacterium]|jgi:predicted lipoprotein with Yx(FWY)xxD motif